MVGKAGAAWPVELPLGLVGDHTKAPYTVRVGHVDTERFKRTNRSRREPIAADLVSSIGRLVEDDDSSPTTRGLHGSSGAGRAGTNHDEVDRRH